MMLPPGDIPKRVDPEAVPFWYPAGYILKKKRPKIKNRHAKENRIRRNHRKRQKPK